IEAGTPELYYLNPSDNLWKVTSMWRVVEHEDTINLSVDMDAFGDLVTILIQGNFININVGKEDKEKAARFDHKDAMKEFSIEMNPNFVQLGVKGDDFEASKRVARMYIFKLNAEEIKNYAEGKNEC
ncbi:hypothetical protein MKX03_004470, partial [Papaver bracteatum]